MCSNGVKGKIATIYYPFHGGSLGSIHKDEFVKIARLWQTQCR